MHSLPTLAFLNNILGMDGLVILVVGLLIFGRRLPEVGKNLGKTIVEFKKGLSGSYSADEAPAEPEEAPPAKRIAGSNRVSVNPNLEAPERTARVAKRLPETEEV